jgi:hypothetical protein
VADEKRRHMTSQNVLELVNVNKGNERELMVS